VEVSDDTLAQRRVRAERDDPAAGRVRTRSADAGDVEGDVGDVGDDGVDRAERLQDRLAIPVLLAAVASVPAVFLTLFEGNPARVGSVVNTISGGVLIGEAVILLAASEDRLAWVRRNWFLAVLAIVMVPAVIFAVGPVQLLRLVRTVGALRIIRARRILKAGKILRERAELNETWHRAAGFGVSLLVAGFVAMVLSDPTSQTRQLLDGAVDRVGVISALLAGVVLATATWVVLTARKKDREETRPAESAEP
jgi:CsoR family transcriptional regulator, copper-sensing transcriptional repressor